MEQRILDEEAKKMVSKIANTVRQLTMDAVQKADSGHPGLPMGCAEIGAYLYGFALRQNPKNPKWLNRDRLVLSAGHGSMWLYSLLHLSGYNLPLEEIKHFRQLHSKTPGHPEYGETDGVEATTGPLGQGTGNAVGMALGLKMLAAKFNTKEQTLFDSKVFCLCSDGDMMEGVSHEVSAFAGHLQLDNLIFIYDANQICLDGPLSECASENTTARFAAYGWETYEIDGYDMDALHTIVSKVREKQQKPVFILARTIIGCGAPTKAGSHVAHGSPLGSDEVAKAKGALGLSEEPFNIPKVVSSFFQKRVEEQKEKEESWNETLRLWSKTNPELFGDFQKMKNRELPETLEEELWKIEIPEHVAGRNASQLVLARLADLIPGLIGGSADLSSSDKTMMKKFPLISRNDFSGRNIKYGVREFGMGTIANGLSYTQMFIPLVGTFLTFSDYMRNSIRLASLSKLQVIYQFSHDSIFLGEDGPTHQPIEHYMALRAIPNLHVMRPADANEVRMAWMAALLHKEPTAILVTRQNLPTFKETKVPYKEGVARGGYILRKEKKKPDFTLFATGSEVALALRVADELEKRAKGVRVISMPSWDMFDRQEESYKESVLGGDIGKRVSIEAGVDLGWYKYIGREGTPICMDTFGASAPADALAVEFGFTVDAVLERIL